MLSLWPRLIQWIDKHAPQLNDGIHPGASEAEIKSLENLIGQSLPADLLIFYRVHNGQKPDFEYLMDGEELLSLQRMGDEWKIWKDLLDSGDFEEEGKAIKSEPEEGIKNDWWNPAWIPLTYDGAGNHYCLDLDPSPSGTPGQIIRMWHDSAERELIADSFKEWMGAFVEGLEQGSFIYSEEYGAIILREDVDADFIRERMSYYKIIDGRKYDARLFYRAQSLNNSQGDGRISREDAQLLFQEALDAGMITPIENATILYLLGTLNWTAEAESWMNEALQLDHPETEPNELRSYQLFVENELRKFWQAQYKAFKKDQEDLSQLWEEFKVDRRQEGLPEEVQESLDYYMQQVASADFGSVRLYAIPESLIIEGEEDSQGLLAVRTTTDGDDGWIEIFDFVGTPLGNGRTYIELVAWGEQEAIRAFTQNGGFPSSLDNRQLDTLWGK